MLGAPSIHVRPSMHGGTLLVIVVLVAIVTLVLVLVRQAPSRVVAVEVRDPLLGRRTYANCQACHGIDGRGVAGYAPTLIAAPSLAGDGRVAIAMILTGGRKDGFNTVMPDFARLSDIEIAAVMTYVRSTWGNAGAAMTSDTVAAVRRTVGDPRSVP